MFLRRYSMPVASATAAATIAGSILVADTACAQTTIRLGRAKPGMSKPLTEAFLPK